MIMVIVIFPGGPEKEPFVNNYWLIASVHVVASWEFPAIWISCTKNLFGTLHNVVILHHFQALRIQKGIATSFS